MPAEVTETIRPAGPADIPALGRLFHEVFGQQRPDELWSWKFFDDAHRGASFVCEAGGRIVAHCGGTPVRFRDAGGEYRAYQSVDFMSSPTYPGGIGAGGVFVRTVQEFFRQMCGAEKAPLVYGFPGERHRLLGEKLLGYRPVEIVGELALAAQGGEVSMEPLTERQLKLFDTAFAVGARRDDSYLRWRYVQHPIHRYGYVEAKRALWRSKVASILRETEECFYLMELGGDITESGLHALTRVLSRLGKPVRGWISPRHPIGVGLQAAGFTSSERDHYLECRFFTGRPHPVAGEFYYTLGDYDVF